MFNNLQKNKNGFCPGIFRRVKIQNENASFAQILTYSKEHQKLGHPRIEMTRATATIGVKVETKTRKM